MKNLIITWVVGAIYLGLSVSSVIELWLADLYATAVIVLVFYVMLLLVIKALYNQIQAVGLLAQSVRETLGFKE